MFSDDELLAYADEQLALSRSASVELELRTDASLARRFADLLSHRDQGDHTLGQLWRRHRLSCPPRAIWEAFIAGRLGDGLSQYLKFHVETVGCRICSANLSDLQHSEPIHNSTVRTKKIFQSSAGQLRAIESTRENSERS